jgi:hypothetical protein
VELGIIAVIMEAIKRRDIVGRMLGRAN